ncbi:MAG: DNA replication/repair protein RecF [Acidaminococcaceae bacterium]|nr:DNA replication/repair protein RecF [Acidaminococcaceae bacterium]
MKIEKIQGINFRNYKSFDLPIDNMTNVFYGQNAQGKTNILESIFYAAFGISHRTNQEENLFLFDSRQMMVKVQFDNNNDNHFVQIKKYFNEDNRSKKDIIIDENKHSLRDYYGFLNVVMFSPEDLQIVKGEPSLRRRFIDMQISQTDKKYLNCLMQYNKLLRQRNTLLKQIKDGLYNENILDSWDGEFVKLAQEIYFSRQRALQQLVIIAQKILFEISHGEYLSMEYITKGLHRELAEGIENYEEFFVKELADARNLDIIRGTTNIGPHRDDIAFKINDLLLKNYGSQGQQRSVALALKLSQLEYVKKEMDEYPILLLDDVMSELDEFRRSQLLQFLDGRVQTFITVNDRSLIPENIEGAYFKIEHGTITKVN